MIKSLKRAFVLGMTSLILFTGMPMKTVQAADSKPVHTQVSVSGKTDKQVVTYKVNLDKANVTDGRIAVTYDKDLLTLTGDKTGISFEDKDFNKEYVSGDNEGLAYAFVNTAPKTANGTLLTLTFSVKAGIENQDTVIATEVFGVNNADTEVVSNVVLEDKVSVGRPKPAQPTNLKLYQTLAGITSVWDRDPNADGYILYRGDSKDKMVRWADTKNLTFFYDSDYLKNNSTYYYQVVAYQKNGNEVIYSQPSKIVSIKFKKFFGWFG